MKLISHRGNLTGPNPELENSVAYIEMAMKKGFDVEIDLWMIENEFYLGHDRPEYRISFKFLLFNKNKLWIHCKNNEALVHLSWLTSTDIGLNFFWHQTDDYTLTSTGWIWAYPGKTISQPGKAITVLQGKNEFFDLTCSDFAGVCSDYIETYANDQTRSVRP